MYSDPRKELARLVETFQNRGHEFSADYMAVCELHTFLKRHPEAADLKTISVLKGILEGHEHLSQKQSLFFYREAATALTSIVMNDATERALAEHAMFALKKILRNTAGNPRRATAEAIGSLPLCIQGPAIGAPETQSIRSVSWDELLEHLKIQARLIPKSVGRSLVLPLNEGKELLVFKFARDREAPISLCIETLWMEHLLENRHTPTVRFNIPRPIKIGENHLFRLINLPFELEKELGTHSERLAIGFVAHRDYFTYVNGCMSETGLGFNEFKNTLFQNAWLLGTFASAGIVHSAPIPLFHNRFQRDRRSDHGLYEWPRGGRLDRWLYSCRYPNFGLTGLRDFEHLISLQGGTSKLYQHVGTHILSLLLVAGSYFRNQDSGRSGLGADGKPTDARALFDKDALEELIKGVFHHYYHAFVEDEFHGEMPSKLDELAYRMIEEMGVDRYMEEILRVVDQRTMTDGEFRHFLLRRGYREQDVEKVQKGIVDIVVHTGPHLGGFNDRTSLPELTEFVSSASALCIVGKYLKQRSFKAAPTDQADHIANLRVSFVDSSLLDLNASLLFFRGDFFW